MSKKNKEIEKIILSFEDKKISSEEAIKFISEITENRVTEYELENYWRSSNLEDFIKLLAIESIPNWKEIDDDKAIFLINEVLLNIDDNTILEKNTDALEKRYSKSKGAISDWIFQDDINDPIDLLQLLKKNNTISL